MQDQEDNHDGEREETPDSAAKYIASLTDELAKLAKRNGLETLSYLLQMARLAARSARRGHERPDQTGRDAGDRSRRYRFRAAADHGI